MLEANYCSCYRKLGRRHDNQILSIYLTQVSSNTNEVIYSIGSITKLNHIRKNNSLIKFIYLQSCVNTNTHKCKSEQKSSNFSFIILTISSVNTKNY